jgi:isocitrate dehydrogenase
LDYYDLGIEHRDATDDQVTVEAAEAIKQHGVGVKCATITPDEARMKEFNLKKMWLSPNGTIRNILGGTIFRAPIVISNVPRLVPGWTKPIIIGRHAFGDQYRAFNTKVEARHLHGDLHAGGRQRADRTTSSRSPRTAALIGHVQLQKSIQDFARGRRSTMGCNRITRSICRRRTPSLAATTDVQVTSSNASSTRITGAVRREGSDLRAPADRRHGGGPPEVGGRLRVGVQELRRRCAVRHRRTGLWVTGLMTSVRMTADGKTVEAEAAHGTVTRHYRQYQQGKPTSTNPIASIFAWTRGLEHRGKLDNTPDVIKFANTLEDVVINTVEGGQMTKDLAILIGPNQAYQTSEEYLGSIADNLKKAL